MYTIKSESDEGIYYLCCNWEKHKAFWKTKDKFKNSMFFKTVAGAKRSLTCLLKVMDDYKNDKFTICDENFNEILNIE